MSEIDVGAASETVRSRPPEKVGLTVGVQLFCHLLIPVFLGLFLKLYLPITLFSFQERGIPLSAMARTVVGVSEVLSGWWFAFVPLALLLLVGDGVVTWLLLVRRGLSANRGWFFGVLGVQAVLLFLVISAF